jgi:hypothetical protein
MTSAARCLTGLATGLALSVAGGAAAQNVVANPDFAGNLTSWSVGANGAFDVADCCGDPVPGSASGATGASNGNKVVVTQCVAYDAVANPQFGFGGRISITDASGAGGVSFAQISAQFFSDAACTTAVGAAFTVGPSPVVSTSGFTLFALTAQTTPATATAALISINVRRAANTGAVVAGFDHVFLGAGLTTPVSVIQFGVE